MSGCPVFADVGGSQKLLGLLCAGSDNGNACYQPLDGVIDNIRKSLENGK